ncbi:glycoside hydrolase family 36 protein [Poronia punctata]|nr:glycoside hydrolase family 36 protein [Poronia punctata]
MSRDARGEATRTRGVVGLHSYPPLGRVSQSTTSQDISFSAVLAVADDDRPWEVCVWHSSGEEGSPWEETSLSPAAEIDRPSQLPCPDPKGNRRLFYHASLPRRNCSHFTLKFRPDPTQAWSWAKDHLGLDDGLVLPPFTLGQDNDLSDVIHGLNPLLKVKSVASQTPRTQLWTVEAPVGPATTDESGYANVELGTPWGHFVRYFALVRHSNAWLGPRHGKDEFNIDKDALLCSFLSPEGKHVVILATSNVNNVMTLFRSSDTGSVMIHMRNDGDSDSNGIVLAAVGEDCDSAMSAVVYHARSVVTFTSEMEDSISPKGTIQSEDVRPEWMQNWYDGLGYCTWNALGQNLTEDKILNAVDSLKENDILISNLIIDDNWQDIDRSGANQHSYGWNRFEAEPQGFPDGLKHTITQIREKFSSIEHVAVWHALLGYWGGISPNGEIAKNYQTVKVDREADGPMTVINEPDVGRFYDDFYRFLSSCGIDGVKTDGQFMLDTWVSPKHRRDLTNTYLDAWTISCLRHFGEKAISCMSQAPRILFRQQLPQTRPTIPVRNSDDFFPDVPASHPWHIWANAHNALFTQHLNVLPDWDMFQTGHDLAGYHAAARCISGGPIYITDVPGKHDVNLIQQMTALTPRGKTVILRPSVLGRAVDPYIGYEEDALLKIGSYHGKSATGTPLLGIFNTRPHTLTDFISLDSFPGILASNKYILRSYTTGLSTPSKRLLMTLPMSGYDIITAHPITQFTTETNGVISIASLGLVDKMTGATAIVSNTFGVLPKGRISARVQLKALGKLGLYISDLPHMNIENDFMAMIQDSPIPVNHVSVDTRNPCVLVIDVLGAFKETGLRVGWSDEIFVKVYFDGEHL